MIQLTSIHLSSHSFTRSIKHQARTDAPQTGSAGYTHVRGDLQQSGGKDDMVAPEFASHRGCIQLYQARATRRKTVHHTADHQHNVRNGRQNVHVPSRQSSNVQKLKQRCHAQRIS